VILPPYNYCKIQNPVVADVSEGYPGKPKMDDNGQVKVRL
jgi:hypothetical protein